MARASPAQTAFNAGEWSPRLEGRSDIEKYRNACRVLENFFPLIQGGAMKRPGTRFVAETKDSSSPSVLLPFQFNVEQAYQLEFGGGYMRVHMDGAQVLDPSTGLPYEIATPFAAVDVAGLARTQSADVLYLAHPSYPPQKVSRTGHAAWTITEIDWFVPPFRQENINEAVRMWVSASTGAGVTLTSNTAMFAATDVGRIIRLREVPEMMHRPWQSAVNYSASEQVHNEKKVYRKISGTGTANSIKAPVHDVLGQREMDGISGNQLWELDHFGSGYVEITAYVSTVAVTVTVIHRVPETFVGTADDNPGAYTHFERFRWSWGAWDAISGYPRAVVFHEDRLWWAGSALEPQTLWGSQPGHYESHRSTDDDESALIFTLNTDSVNAIEWIVAEDNLVLGTRAGIFPAPALDSAKALSPGNPIQPRKHDYGTRPSVRPVQAGKILFPQRSGQTLRELSFDFGTDDYQSIDLSIMADHIVTGRISRLAYQQEPARLVWAIMEDGTLAAMTYERLEGVIGAWHRHVLGGSGVTVESISVISSQDADELWLIVRRTIDGQTKRYVERLDPPWSRGTAIEESFHADSGLTYTGAPADLISGLGHLEGETVAILADGAVHPQRVVAGGQVQLDYEASVVQIGLPYLAKLQTMRFEAGAQDGTAQGKTKRIQDVVLRLDQAGEGLWYGPEPDLALMDPAIFRETTDPMGEPLPLFDGDTEVLPWPGGWEMEGRVALVHDTPLPCTVLAIYPHLLSQER